MRHKLLAKARNAVAELRVERATDPGFVRTVRPVLEELVAVLEEPGDELARPHRAEGVVFTPKREAVRALQQRLGRFIAPCFVGDGFASLAEWVPDGLRETIRKCAEIATAAGIEATPQRTGEPNEDPGPVPRALALFAERMRAGDPVPSYSQLAKAIGCATSTLTRSDEVRSLMDLAKGSKPPAGYRRQDGSIEAVSE